MAAPRILALAGSLRAASYNKQILAIAAGAAAGAGADVVMIDLREYPLPLYDGDLEAAEGLPANALALKEHFIDAGGLLIASPEYNSSITGVLKNTIDWVSRPAPGEKHLAAFDGKFVTLMSASTGALGGLRGLVHVRAIFSNLGAIVLPGQVALPAANQAFTADGRLADIRRQAAIENLGTALAATLTRWHRD